ncbi:hypothetical protein MASR1M8_04820 [Thermomonas brevis]
MSKLRTVLFAVAACAALAACKKDATDPVADATTPPPAVEDTPVSEQAPPIEPPADAMIPVTVSADAVKVGSSLGPDQAASAPKPSYSLADTVYASARTSGRGTAYVYWTYEDGISHKEEQKPVTGNTVSFDFKQADGMKAGKYNVEIGVDDKPIGIVDFVVR